MSKNIIYQNNKCYLCKSKSLKEVKGRVRDSWALTILKCKNCGLVFLDNFAHITDDFYEESKMLNKLKLDEYLKDCERDDVRRVSYVDSLVVNKKLLDFGCGGGGLLASLKNKTQLCMGVEKDRTLRKHIFWKHNIKVYSDIKEVKEKFDIITLFHVIEHMKDPKTILKKIASKLQPNGSMIIETPNCDDALLSLYDCNSFRKFTYWSCHLYLFNQFTLRNLIEDSNLKIEYIKQVQRYSLSNHLYWLAKGKGDGHKIWSGLNNDYLNNIYENTLASLGKCDTLIASIKKRG